MESIEKEYERLRKRSNLSRSISDVDKCIQLLQNARAAIANGGPPSALSAPPPPLSPPPDLTVVASSDCVGRQDPTSSAVNLTKLQQSVPATLDRINDTQKEIYAGLNRYGRSLDKVPLIPFAL